MALLTLVHVHVRRVTHKACVRTQASALVVDCEVIIREASWGRLEITLLITAFRARASGHDAARMVVILSRVASIASSLGQWELLLKRRLLASLSFLQRITNDATKLWIVDAYGHLLCQGFVIKVLLGLLDLAVVGTTGCLLLREGGIQLRWLQFLLRLVDQVLLGSPLGSLGAEGSPFAFI